MKSEAAAQKLDVTRLAEGLMKLKLSSGKGFFKIGVEKKHGEANSIYLEINGSRKFEIGNDCDTCHFWFKCTLNKTFSTGTYNTSASTTFSIKAK